MSAGIPELVESGQERLAGAGRVGRPIWSQPLEAVLAATPAQLAAMGEEGRVRVRAGHDSEKIGAQIADILRRFG